MADKDNVDVGASSDPVADTTTDVKQDTSTDKSNGHSNGVEDKADEKDTQDVKDTEEDKEETKEEEADDKNDVAKDDKEDVVKEDDAIEEDAIEEDKEDVAEDADTPADSATSRDVSVANDTIADTTTDSIDLDPAAFPAGTVVLAKVKGFPAWPGMVVPEKVLPSSVLNAKPRKNRQMWPVRFFIDTTHTWAYRNDLKPLGVDEAAKFLKSAARGRKDKSLHAAYKVASEPPTLDEFVEQVYGDGEEEEEEEEEKPPAKKRKTGPKPAAAGPKGKASAVKEAVEKAKKKSGTNAKDNAKEEAKETKGAKGGAKADAKASSASPALSSKPKSSPAPKRSDKEGKVLVIRHKLQRGLLSGSVPEDSELPGLSQYLTRLEEFEGLETSIIRQTKINKVLKGIVKLDTVPKDEEYGFKERSLKLLTEWNKLE